ncbi:hypothetical protein X777_02666 [Ooceraea biroi]|uniref:ER-bound oxygenase mpaB/mpaB'/Rubber oxygenase catalytic domain-containing protein n=1 Tax=Ooceraea biroi TaxID=2015173 RepID=A0A026WLA2_OOCBI|nr:hypothetical protein X777_02666 [Ooceraea biroi]
MVAFNNTLSDCVQNSKDSLSNSYEYENVVTFKSRFDRKLFPEDFDVWTVHKQYTWINKNLIKFFPNVPQSLLNYIPAAFKQPDFDRSPVEIPEWLDMEKYSRGQKFVRENWASIMLSSLMGIICSYSFDDVLKPLIITRQSDTPYLGFIRYLSTMQRVINWYNGQPWVQETAAYKDMQYTRRMHLMIRKKLCQLNNEEIDNASKIAKPWCPDRELLLKDFTTLAHLENSDSVLILCSMIHQIDQNQ